MVGGTGRSSQVKGLILGYRVPYDEGPGSLGERVIAGLICQLEVNDRIQDLDRFAQLTAKVAYGFGRALFAKAHSGVECAGEVKLWLLLYLRHSLWLQLIRAFLQCRRHPHRYSRPRRQGRCFWQHPLLSYYRL